MRRKVQLSAPAGNLASLCAAVDVGADCVYVGFRSATNLRNLPGLNLTVEEAVRGVAYARRRGAKVYVAVNTHPLDEQLDECRRAVDQAVDIGADAVIAADWAVLDYARMRHPELELHLSCLAGCGDAASVRFYRKEFGVSCIVLPRGVSLKEIAALRSETDVLLEVIAFGVLCVNCEGRCYLSSFITGRSANSYGACAPAELIEFEETPSERVVVKLGGVVINEFGAADERTYPTPCKGRYYNRATGRLEYAFQDPCCLNCLELLPQLAAAGVDVLKIEGRQRSLAYVKLVTRVWRTAIDSLNSHGAVEPELLHNAEMAAMLEGRGAVLETLGGG